MVATASPFGAIAVAVPFVAFASAPGAAGGATVFGTAGGAGGVTAGVVVVATFTVGGFDGATVVAAIGAGEPNRPERPGMCSRIAQLPAATPTSRIAAIAHGKAELRGAWPLTAVGRSSTGRCAAAPATGGGSGCPLGVMRVFACAATLRIGVCGVCGNEAWPDTGVFWPIIVAAAVDIFVCAVIGPPFETSGCWLRSVTRSWQFW